LGLFEEVSELLDFDIVIYNNFIFEFSVSLFIELPLFILIRIILFI
jgi:hypothetical protein